MLYRRCASNQYLQAFSYLHRKLKIKSKRESWSWSNFKFASGYIKYSQTSHRRTAEVCDYCKASKVRLVWLSFFDIRTESENPILIFKILFWPSHWVRKSYFDIKILFWQDFPTQFECQNRILNVKVGFSDSVWMSKYDFPTQFEYRKTKNEKRKTKKEKRKSNQLHLACKAPH